eukprot:scaffold2062_cov35-Prasinocladus_malaysianus.AAC.1
MGYNWDLNALSSAVKQSTGSSELAGEFGSTAEPTSSVSATMFVTDAGIHSAFDSVLKSIVCAFVHRRVVFPGAVEGVPMNV